MVPRVSAKLHTTVQTFCCDDSWRDDPGPGRKNTHEHDNECINRYTGIKTDGILQEHFHKSWNEEHKSWNVELRRPEEIYMLPKANKQVLLLINVADFGRYECKCLLVMTSNQSIGQYYTHTLRWTSFFRNRRQHSIPTTSEKTQHHTFTNIRNWLTYSKIIP